MLRASYGLDAVMGAGAKVLNKTGGSGLHRAYPLMEDIDNEQVHR